MKKPSVLSVILKIIATVFVICFSLIISALPMLLLSVSGLWLIFAWLVPLFIPSLAIPLIWFKKYKRIVIIWLSCVAVYILAICINLGIIKYNASITIDTSPNINVHEYLPFEEDSKIVKIENELLFEDEVPVIDGAAAVFPVYSAFVNAVYPSPMPLNESEFQYNNTSYGYQLLAQRETDIFFGAYPSEKQIAYAEECGTEFEYTPIGYEAFVFFVHKDNPIDSLTTEQIQGIYSGEITNWKQVSGKNEEIAAFQRNEGSGSQSMLIRFMGDKPLMTPPTKMVNDLMSGIIEQVADYQSKSNSIGFSFRYYVEGIIKNPNIKLIAIDGVHPTVDSIKSGSYPIVAPLYAVTYKGNENKNVKLLLDWVLSDEGQYIIEQTGYVGLGK